jgi:phosphopantetheinyl transferase (holo-ACP synthase)
MLGNDVVDLLDPEACAGAQHARFDERVFAEDELRELERSADPVRTRWTLWAAKEAALKCARRCDPGLLFAPRRFRVELAAGCVRSGVERLRLHVVASGGALHAIAARPGARIAAGLARLAPGEDAGRAARALAVSLVAARVGAAEVELAIERGADRIPRVLREGRLLPHAVSLSHHGRFAACAVGFAP